MNLQFKNYLKNLTPPIFRDSLINFIFSIRTLFYKGKNVLCPCCERTFSQFFPAGEYGDCPYCGSGARHRSVMLFLKNKTNFFKDNLKVLHFAPEYCFNKRFKKLPNLDYVTADINSARAMEKLDMTSIKYNDNSFDVILSIHVLEHIDDDRKAMRELYRVLKPGGWAVLQVPIDYKRQITYENPEIITSKAREKAFGHFDHRRIYGRDYKERLEFAGFIVNNPVYTGEFNPHEKKRYGLKDYEEVYFCKKQ